MGDLRLTLMILGGIAIVAILVHGLWSIRKNGKGKAKPKFENRSWKGTENIGVSSDSAASETVFGASRDTDDNDPLLFDDEIIGEARVVQTNNATPLTTPEIDLAHEQNIKNDAIDYTAGDAITSEINNTDVLMDEHNQDDVSATLDDAKEHAQQPVFEASLLSESPLDNNDTTANDEIAPATPETESKLYASVVTQPKPRVRATANANNTTTLSAVDVPEPPPFLLKQQEDADTPKAGSQTADNETSHLTTGTNTSKEKLEEHPEPDFELNAQESKQQGVERAATVEQSLKEQAKKFVSRKRKSVADRIRREPTLADVDTDKEEQIRIDFAEESTSSVSSNTEQHTSNEQASNQADAKPHSSMNSTAAKMPPEVLVLNVKVSEETPIQGAALLPMLLTLGCKFGEQDIFHRHVNTNGKGPVLFSLANILKPGIFDIDNLETFTTPGLSLFMILPIEGEPQQVFNMMHNAARKIAEEFGGQVLDGRRSVLTKQGLQQYSERIREFERKRKLLS